MRMTNRRRSAMHPRVANTLTYKRGRSARQKQASSKNIYKAHLLRQGRSFPHGYR